MTAGADSRLSQIMRDAVDCMRARRKVALSEELRYAGISAPNVSGILA